MTKVVTVEQAEVLAKGVAQQLDAKKVEKVSGKGLSTNDYGNDDKLKVTGMEAGAQKNKLESVQVNGTALPISSKAVNIDLSAYAKKTEIPTVVNIETASESDIQNILNGLFT